MTHPAAAAVDGMVYVLGGTGSLPGSQTSRILAIDPSHGRIERVGKLPVGLSDAGATVVANTIVLAGDACRAAR